MNKLSAPRYFTKSLFKLGLECPTKLYYSGKKEYSNKSLDDSFLEALAQGGYQVGELAKHYYPGGHCIKSFDYEEALSQTSELLKQDKVIIYEAAIRYQNLFIRVDILIKNGNNFDLIEVKAKSFDPDNIKFIKKNNSGLLSSWAPYVQDVAFQRFVLANAFPEMKIDAYLMLADKTVKAGRDGLNTKFKIVKHRGNRKGISVSDTLSSDDFQTRVLSLVNVNETLDFIYNELDYNERSFESHVSYLASGYINDERSQGELKSKCKGCEFQCSQKDEESGLINGYKECWKTSLGWCNEDFDDSLVTEVWNLKSCNKLIEQGKFKLADLDEDDINIKEDSLPGLSSSQRQWLQIEKVQNQDSSIYLDKDSLRQEMNSWTFPLHFIDFETTATALPFTKGRTPYEGIAFQFSHHIVYEDGRVEHHGEFLDTRIGHFPNFEFVKQLKQQLGNDEGTIFRYSNHENTYLNQIFWQLKGNSGLPVDDINELCDFIKTITHSAEKSTVKWKGVRDMVDLWHLVKRYYYDPYTKGSNSIKYVLPAVLNSSDYIKKKYSEPIYGAENGIPSHNFENFQWVSFDDDKVKDPYSLLPKMFEDAPENMDELLSGSDTLANGGAALTAYAKLQFTEMSDYERGQIKSALLKYCELDTLAMVMIYEAWREWVKTDSTIA